MSCFNESTMAYTMIHQNKYDQYYSLIHMNELLNNYTIIAADLKFQKYLYTYILL